MRISYKNLDTETLINTLVNPKYLATLDIRLAIKAELMQRGVTEIKIPLDFSNAGINRSKALEIFETLSIH